MNNLYTIGQTAEILGVSVDTLRRWGKREILIPKRSTGGHRYYRKEDVDNYLKNIDVFELAKKWVKGKEAKELPSFYYCQYIDVFRARLGTLETILMRIPEFKRLFSVIVAVAGEIGNNSYDHNFGNWPDVGGIFFGYNLDKRQIVLADRGQGVLSSLKKVKPELENDRDALEVAFTEVISGRAPENRGNGLKYVRNMAVNYNLEILFQSGNAKLRIKPGDNELYIRSSKHSIKGCLALIKY